MKTKILSGLLALILAFGIIGAGCAEQVSLSTAEPEAVGLSSERLERIAPVMQENIDEQLIPCSVTLVARHGKIVYFEAQGWMDVAGKIPVKKDSLFRMYSMTKPITTVAVLILYEEGRLQLDDPISKYIPAFKNQVVKTADNQTVPANREITIRDVLTMTSGVPGYGVGMSTPGIDASTPMKDIVNKLAEFPLNFQPGTAWEYGFGPAIAGVVVEVISGKTLDEFFKERIFEPLGMKDTSFYVPEDKASRLVNEYVLMPVEGVWKLMLAPPLPYSSDKIEGPKVQFGGDGWGGGVVSTAEDYARFAQMLLNGGELDGVRIISRKSVELMSTNHTGDLPLVAGTTVTPGYGWGLCVSVLEDITGLPGIGSVGQFGWGGAAFTWFFVDPEEDLIAIRLSQVLNAGNVDVTKINDIFNALVYQALE
jgi:CubicO group peptidase (beta-lactamase class C family)